MANSPDLSSQTVYNHQLKSGEAVQFDAILRHTYEALESCQMIVVHPRIGKRF
jgi:hypothetical protein